MRLAYLSTETGWNLIGKVLISNLREGLLVKRGKLRTSLLQTSLRSQMESMSGDNCFLIDLGTPTGTIKGRLTHDSTILLCRIPSIPSPNPTKCQLVTGKGKRIMHVSLSNSTLSNCFPNHPRRRVNRGQFHNRNFDTLLFKQRAACKYQVNGILHETWSKFKSTIEETKDRLKKADLLPKLVAKQIVYEAGNVLGLKRPTHKKGKYESPEIVKAKAEISTIKKTRDLIRILYLDECQSLQSQRYGNPSSNSLR